MDKDNSVVIIAVMGATGSGKSTFIQLVTGSKDVGVGDTLLSETKEVCEYHFSHKGINYILIDTPGFDGSYRSDIEVTELILIWLEKSMVSGRRLNGIIYLYRISDIRMGGSALRNTQMFRKLVGKDALQNVKLATVFWEQVPDKDVALAFRREKELRDLWGSMLEHGAQIVRLQNNRKSGLRFLEKFSEKAKVVLEDQNEIVNLGKLTEDTAALRELVKEVDDLERELKENLRLEKKRLEKDIERQKSRQQHEVRKLQAEMERNLEAQRQIERHRLTQEEEDAQGDYERKRMKLEADKERQERQRRREIKELEKRERGELKRRKRRAKRLNRYYQRQYVCIGYTPKRTCVKCRGKLTRRKYYYRE
ncbi:conserved hypothetical protein [Talaromyces stipitatus ATCC 10500]|uniref:G domain-containing protein n=1 Tax=Talaromyces stipitatus (strain ATCC 10500 / CBS 375.48 / QM 6759 / NRRL 1006) TaxID=441959 RepID=B8M510_TALSN|nr:uncharacterized protein TSTA_028970 [Talaromyces stipitatus ATCC 10500]EED19616.1 conserved hypothetical protein [Talaromyces stipitatus ATCC 10500]